MAYTYTLKDKIFSFFGVNAKAKDAHKDVNGKGICERYQESIGEDYDEEFGPLADNFHDNLADPRTCFSQFIENLEHMIGDPVIVFSTDAFRRKMIMLQNTITMIKGTYLSHQVLFGMLGITDVTITTIDQESGFDSSMTLDDDLRVFDRNRIFCPHYNLDLLGSAAQDDELNSAILRIAFYLKPIDSEIIAITYNTNPVPLI